MKVLIYIIIYTCPLGYVRNSFAKKSENTPTCATPGCIRAASAVLENLDKSVDPCDDFFQFACGGFAKRTVIPNDKNAVNQFTLIGDKIVEQLRVVLEQPTLSNEIKPFGDLKRFYKLCMDEETIEKVGLEVIKKLFDCIGGWPLLNGKDWDENGFDWKETTYKFRKIGIKTDSILNVYVGEYVLNSSQYIINIDQAVFGLDREYLVNGTDNEILMAYHEYLIDLATTLGADEVTAKREIRDALNFEVELAKISLSREERRNVSALTNPMTVEELQRKYSSIPWKTFINCLINLPNICVGSNDLVDVGTLNYISQLETLLIDTPKRVQANYLFYRTLIDSVTYLTRALRDRQLKYSEVKNGIKDHEPRWRECVTLAATEMKLATDALYVRRYFNTEAKRIAEELVAIIKKTFIQTLKQVDWMDGTTKEKALEKAAAMSAHVAFPNELLDDTKLTKYYAEMDRASNTFLEYGLALQKFSDDVSFKKLPKVVNKSDWTSRGSATSVNAYYNVIENSIELSAGILQSPLFDANRPNYMNYGSIGFVIGHEITHGFDDVGSQFDKNGTLHNWWAEKTKLAFDEKAQCLIEQYSNYTDNTVNLNLNGFLTQGENIADNGGVKEAYIAYNSWVKRHREEPLLPNVNYSQRQLFWISTAHLWCATQKKEYLEELILTDSHAPNNFRVLGPLRNTEFFAKDFQCKRGTNMNPIHKCQVW